MKDGKPIDDYQILVKYKNAKMPDDMIAAKMGISVEKVNNMWTAICEQVKQIQSTGYEDLKKQWWIFCQQYELLGESLKLIAGALSNVMPAPEIAELLTDNKADTLKNLTSRCIVLRPYAFTDPIQSLEQSTKRLQKNN